MWYFVMRKAPEMQPEARANRPDTATNPSIFMRLKATDASPREIAWADFSTRYAPIISSFAKRLGAQQNDIDDITQDVMLGFFLRSPKFIYDPAKGRFRSYLKVCTDRALRRRLGRDVKFRGRSLDEIDPADPDIDKTWNDVWEQQLLKRAVEDVRESVGHTKAFQAFERYVVLDEHAPDVAEKLAMHLNSVYRAKEQITKLIRDRVNELRDDE
jgi:DNA-directed RNA polymerase specialized sigma24 family protein